MRLGFNAAGPRGDQPAVHEIICMKHVSENEDYVQCPLVN